MTVVILKFNHHVNSISLDCNELVNKWEKSKNWNIIKYIYGKNTISYINNDKSIQILYPNGSWAPSAGERYGFGGFNFYSQPKIFPIKHICFKYDLKFNSNFNWVKGGKLPGLWIGDIGASGGNHNINGYSYRMSWHTNGTAQAYIYIPKLQDESYYNISGLISDSVYGDTLWRGSFFFDRNIWYSIKLYIKLNTFKNSYPNYDGIIGLTINETVLTYKKIIWTTNKKHLINGIMMDTFFGGSDPSWATSITTYSYLRNLKLSTQC